MNVPIDKTAPITHAELVRTTPVRPERAIALYWLLSVIVGGLFLWDWLTVWNVPATLGQPWLVLYLSSSFALSQILYGLVARHGGRPVRPGPLLVFALGNGIAETFAFAIFYRIGELVGAGLIGLVAPAFASLAGFIGGVIGFSVYGGLIHALFWLRVLPPHLDDAPRARTIRKLRPLAEVALVLGWSLCFWLHRDIWTVIFFHTLVDVGLMLFVRPPLFSLTRHVA